MKTSPPIAGVSDEAQQASIFGVRPQVAVTGLLAAAAIYWLWVAVAVRSITTDPAISILVARSILEHGYPVLPSGAIYDRAYVVNYLVALSIALFGENDISVALPSLPMALGSLFLTYLIARDVLGRPWVGVAAIVGILALSINTHYAASPRMYMGLEFFTVLAVYSAWRGYVQDSARFRVLTVFAVAAASFTHQLGGVLAGGIPLAVVAVTWLERGSRPTARELRRLVPLVVVGMIFAFYIWFPMSGVLRPIAMESAAGGMSGLNLRPRRWAAHLNWLEHAVPLGIFLAPAMLALAVSAVRRTGLRGTAGTVYLLLVFAAWTAGVLGYIRVEGTRFWMGILPIYVLLLVRSVPQVTGAAWASGSRPRALAWGALQLAWAAVVVVGYSTYYESGYAKVVGEGFGVPCWRVESACSSAIEATYRRLDEVVRDGDLIISSNPFVTYYYMGRIDGWLVQREGPGGFASFDSEVDEYFGEQLVDREEELSELRAGGKRVWVVLEGEPSVSASMLSRLSEEYGSYEDQGPARVFLSPAGTE